MNYTIGGIAGAGATIFTNPMDVVKTRLQLQGELKSKSETITRYRGFFHALYVIATTDGLLALQKGLIPAMVFGFVMNSVRLGAYQKLEASGWTKTNDKVSIPKAVLCASACGCVSGVAANPMSVIKTRMQATAHPSIAVGRQHEYTGMMQGAAAIYKSDGLKGFFTGVPATCTRLTVGSGAQLSSFSFTKDLLLEYGICTNSPLGLAFTASAVSGVVIAVIICPFDVTTVRLYNQGSKETLLYKGVFDCLMKIYQKEGFFGMYKGLGPLYMRMAPHTTLTLVIWDTLNNILLPTKSNKS